MDQATFEKYRRVVHANTGIALGPYKQALVAARVARRMRALGLTSHRAYLQRVTEDATGEEMTHLVDAICTNVTAFFREEDHFRFACEAVAGWKAEGRMRLRLWSTACSTGEEVYSLALAACEALESDEQVDLRILGTDLSTKALVKAMAGSYTARQVSPVHPETLRRHFVCRGSSGQEHWSVGPELRRLVVFRQLNLASPPFPMKGSLDLIMCRNVMIYFDAELRTRLLAEFHRLLRPGGYLIVGHAESLSGGHGGFEYVHPAVYSKR